MAKNTYIHRVEAFLKHHLTAWNTTGEGIHSPYLFELVRFILRDENAFYCFSDIERRRDYLLRCEDEIEVLDFGSQGSPEGKRITRRVSDIAKTHLESPKVAQVLFRLVNWLGQHENRPLQIIELGTSLGVTTSYLASPDSRNTVTTFEGSGAVLRIAKGVWRALKIENISWQEGPIDDTLYKYVRAHEADKSQTIPGQETQQPASQWLDVAYLDANHTYEATMRYAALLLPLLPEKGVMILDDIHYSEEMERAWNELKSDPRVTTSMDLYHVGLIFVDPHYLKRHYKIRI